MSENNEPIFENEEFHILLEKYEKMKSGKNSLFFDVEEFEQIIDYYLDEFQYDKASEAAAFGSAQHPASVEIKYKIVHIFLEQGNGKKSLEMLENIPKWEHTNPEFYYLKGTALCITGKIHEAEKCFDTGLDLSSDDIFEALINIAIAFENARHFLQAVKYLEQAYELNPEYTSVLYDLGYFNERLGQYTQSVDYYQKYLDIDPFSENVWYNLGVVYFKINQFENAIKAYDYSIALNPDYASAYFNKANTFASLLKHEEAIETISDFLEIEPENLQALNFLGECYEQIGEYKKAMSIYKRVIDLDNTDSDGWFGAGMVLYQQNKYSESAIYFLKALEFDSKNTDYWINLGYVYEEDNKSDSALKCFKQVVKNDSSDHEGWTALTGLLIRMKEYEEAITQLTAALAAFPEDYVFVMRLAVSHLKLGMEKTGLKLLETALSKSQDSSSEFMLWFSSDEWTSRIRKIFDKYIN